MQSAILEGYIGSGHEVLVVFKTRHGGQEERMRPMRYDLFGVEFQRSHTAGGRFVFLPWGAILSIYT